MISLGLLINSSSKMNFKKSLLLSECDNLEDLTLQGCDGVLDTENKVSGNASIELTKNGDISGFFIADVACVYDLSKYERLRFRFYTADNANIASVSALFFTTIPFSYDVNFLKFKDVESGWNTINIMLSDFQATGEANWQTVKGLRFTINLHTNNITEKVNFDRIEIL